MTKPNPPSWFEAGAALKDYQAKLKDEAKKEKDKKMSAMRKALLLFILAGFVAYAIFRHFFITNLGF